jgi:hypothetical protein
MSEERWARLAELAGQHGCKSWRVLVRKLADGELAIVGEAIQARPVPTAAPAQPVLALPYAEPPKPVPVPFVIPGQRDLSHRRDGAVPMLRGKG